MSGRFKPRAEALLRALADCGEPIGRDDLASRAGLSNKNITPEIGAAKLEIRNKYEGKSGKDGYTANDMGRSLLGLGLIETEKQQYGGKKVDVFWLTEKGKDVIARL